MSSGLPQAPCPGSNLTTITSPSPASNPYSLYCGIDFQYRDLPPTSAATLIDCITVCDNYVANATIANGAGCIAIVWGNPAYTSQNCYPKYQVLSSDLKYQSSLCSARRVGYEIDQAPIIGNVGNLGADPNPAVVESTAAVVQPATETVVVTSAEGITDEAPSSASITASSTQTPTFSTTASSTLQSVSSILSNPTIAISTVTMEASSAPASLSHSKSTLNISVSVSTFTTVPSRAALSSPSSPTTVVSTSTVTTIPSSAAASSGLPFGTTIGIGVGAGVGAVLLLGLLALILLRRRRPKDLLHAHELAANEKRKALELQGSGTGGTTSGARGGVSFLWTGHKRQAPELKGEEFAAELECSALKS